MVMLLCGNLPALNLKNINFMNKKHLIILGLIFTVTTIIFRLIPHPWNFTPLAALAVFSGFVLPKKYIYLPLVAQLISDIFIGTYTWQIMLVVYASYLIIGGMGYILRYYYQWQTVVVTSLAGSIIFFLTTNLAVWFWSGMYQINLTGLLASLTAGIPFFRNTMLGDLMFVGIFFGVFETFKAMNFVAQPKAQSIK